MSTDVTLVVGGWGRTHRDFVVGSNEAGMLLGGEVRGAEAAVWRRADLRGRTGGYRRVPPLLAVEVAGQDEGEAELRAKAAWYFEHGVLIVWLLLPEKREVLVLRTGSESRHRSGERLAPAPELPGLEPDVDLFFSQLG